MATPSDITKSLYKPRPCAFHPNEDITNFCKNPECLLPLCPSCVKIHAEQHKSENTHGEFENIHRVVKDITDNYDDNIKEIKMLTDDVKDAMLFKKKDQANVLRSIKDAKEKMLVVIDRFFNDFEREVTSSFDSFNSSIAEGVDRLSLKMTEISTDFSGKMDTLASQKVLKTVISHYAKREQDLFRNSIEELKNSLSNISEKRVNVTITPEVIQKIVDELGSFIYLTVENWDWQVKYRNQFVRTGSSGQFKSRSITQ